MGGFRKQFSHFNLILFVFLISIKSLPRCLFLSLVLFVLFCSICLNLLIVCKPFPKTEPKIIDFKVPHTQMCFPVGISKSLKSFNQKRVVIVLEIVICVVKKLKGGVHLMITIWVFPSRSRH